MMGIGVSLALIAVGAILKFAVTTSAKGFSIGTVGLILMIIGVLELIIASLLLTTRRRTDIIYGRNGVSYRVPVDRIDRY